MRDDKFEIVADPSKCHLRIKFRGHWGLDTVEAYRRALLQAGSRMEAAGCSRDSMVVLVDGREGGAQSQDVIAAYKAALGGGDLAVRRLATLTSSALFKRQVERIGIANQRLFTDETEAMAWLLSPDDLA